MPFHRKKVASLFTLGLANAVKLGMQKKPARIVNIQLQLFLVFAKNQTIGYAYSG